MPDERWPIPDTWTWVLVTNIASIVGGGTPSSKLAQNFSENGIPWITPADLTDYHDAYIARGRRDLSEMGYDSSSARLLPPGTILFSSRAPIGYCAIAANEISTNQGFKSFVLEGDISPEYIRHYLLSAREYAESKASGTTFLELSAKRVSQIAIPIPPINEQKRIVAKLDRVTNRLSIAKGELESITALIDDYRQFVIDQSFLPLDLTVPLLNLVDRDRGIPYGIVKTGKSYPDGVPTVRAGDIKSFSIAHNQLKRVDPHIAARYARTTLRGGEVLIAIRGSVGETCVVTRAMEGSNLSREVALIPVSPSVSPEFLMYFLKSNRAATYISRNIKGIAQTGINLRDLRRLPCPDIDTGEQQKIAARISAVFKRIDGLAVMGATATALLPMLEHAVRSVAFRGKLVQQDEADEPASALIARIRENRSARSYRRRRKRMRDKTIVSAPQDRLLLDSESWPEAGLPFEEVAKRLPMPHDQMRDALFSLMTGQTPTIRQRFDPGSQCMHLQRVKS